MATTFADLGVKSTPKQGKMVESLLNSTPMLSTMPMEPSSNGNYNVYEKDVQVTGMGLVEMNTSLPKVSADSKLEQVDLSLIAGEIFCPEDKAAVLGGAAAYFAKQTPRIFKKTGMAVEQSVFYNSLQSYAIANGGEHKINAGGSGATNYSIIAVNWVQGEIMGLYNPVGVGRGMDFNVSPYNNGALYKESDGVPGYGVRFKTAFGVQTANPWYVSTICNIDIANDKLPTMAQLDALVASVRANSDGNTFLYMRPEVKTALYANKTSKIELTVGDRNLVTSFDAYNDIPLVTSYNLLPGNEPAVSFA